MSKGSLCAGVALSTCVLIASAEVAGQNIIYRTRGDLGAEGTTIQSGASSEIVSIAGSERFVAALRADGSVGVWGDYYGNRLVNGQYGIGPNSLTTLMSPGSSRAVGANNFGVVVNTVDNRVWAWGENSYGELASGDYASRYTPGVSIVGSQTVSTASGYGHNLALQSNGTVIAWGMNFNGQLGIGEVTIEQQPTTIPTLSNVVSVAAGNRHSLALLADGTVRAWGANNSGQLGIGSIGWSPQRPTPLVVPGLSNIASIVAGAQFSLALDSAGQVFFWGWQLGNDFAITPTLVGGLPPIRSIFTAGATAFGIDFEGRFWHWNSSVDGGSSMIEPTLLRSPLPGYRVLSVSGTTSSNELYYNYLLAPIPTPQTATILTAFGFIAHSRRRR